jgi:hypothetical protein
MMNVKAPQTTSAPATSLDAAGWPGGIAPAPLLPGEDSTEYAKFTARFLAAAKPRDFIEEILARDAIDLSWEILRLRRLKAGLLRVASGAGVRSITAKLGFRCYAAGASARLESPTSGTGALACRRMFAIRSSISLSN